MSHHLNIDTVAIIESLPAIEKQTGKLLEEHLKKNGRDAVYYSVVTANQFLAAIQDVERMSSSLGKRVALHFEIHGTRDGYHLSNGAFVPWMQVRRDIVNLNVSQKNHLLVSMAVCEGKWLLEIMKATKTSPFYALISSQEEIFEADIERGFPVFYDAVFDGKSLEDATLQFNLSQNHSDFTLTTTEEMFAKVFEQYFSKCCSQEAIELRAKKTRKRLTELGVTDRELKHKLVQRYKKTVTKEQEPSFEKYRAEFFMHDAYPENMAEFCPAYEELAGKLGKQPPPDQK